MSRFKSSHLEHRIYEDWVPLYVGSVATPVVASGTGTIEAEVPGDMRGLLAHAAVAPLLAVGDTFDLFVQTLFTCSGLQIWVDVIHFTRVLGNGLAINMYDKIAMDLNQAFFEVGTALAADAQRNLMGEKWRCRWEIGGATPEFVFDLALYPM